MISGISNDNPQRILINPTGIEIASVQVAEKKITQEIIKENQIQENSSEK